MQNLEDKPWKNEELKKLEEALPTLEECDLEKAWRMYKAKIGVGCDGFHPKVPLDLTNEKRGTIVELLEKAEQSGKWPQQAFTTMFFLIPKNVTSERPIALMPTLIRWWEALRAPEVAKWQQKYCVDWDVIDGGNGGAQETVWEMLLEMDGFKYRAGEEDQGALALVRGSVFLWCGPGRRPSASRGYSEHQRRVQFEGCAAEPLRTITAILPGSNWSCLLPRTVLQDALSEVTKIYPPLKLRVFVDDVTALLMGENREVLKWQRR